MDHHFESARYFGRVLPNSDDIVEDSEPERAARRRANRISKKAKKDLPKSVSEHDSDVVLVEDQPGPSNRPPRKPQPTASAPPRDFIDLRMSPPPPPASRQEKLHHPTDPHLELNSGQTQLESSEVFPIVDVQASILNLAHFAYAPVRGRSESKSATPHETTRQASLHTFVQPKVSEKPTGKVAGKRKATSTLDATDLGRLFKCPACGVSWTARKSTNAKVDHIRRCAKKHGIPESVIQQTVNEQLAAPDASGPTRPKGKGKGATKSSTPALAVDHPEEPRTFLDDVVDGAAPRKRKRNPPLEPPTVKPVTETHDVILHRARDLLDDPKSDVEEKQSQSRPVALCIPEVAGTYMPPATQAFASSRLANAFRKPISPSRSTASMSPPPTQAFAPSKFTMPAARAGPSALAFFGEIESPSKSPNRPSQPISIASSPTSTISSTRFMSSPRQQNIDGTITISSDEESIVSRQRQALKQSATASESHSTPKDNHQIQEHEVEEEDLHNSDWSDDDGCLYYDNYQEHPSKHSPVNNNSLDYLIQWQSDEGNSGSSSSLSIPIRQSRTIITSSPPTSTAEVQQRAKHTLKPSSPRPRPRPIAQLNKTTRSPRKKTKQAIAGDDAPSSISDDQLYKRLKAMILEDEALHCRILRYEPIEFDLFVAKATERGLQSRTLESRLRIFLHAACVMFFEGDRNGRQKRR